MKRRRRRRRGSSSSSSSASDDDDDDDDDVVLSDASEGGEGILFICLLEFCTPSGVTKRVLGCSAVVGITEIGN